MSAMVLMANIMALLAVSAAELVATSANAMDANRPCPSWLAAESEVDRRPEQDEAPLLTANQCEALEQRELRLQLLEIPQDHEDPMALSLSAKDSGVSLRLKVPFSF
jgi:hypothetical protein